jgi:hypothetical protein
LVNPNQYTGGPKALFCKKCLQKQVLAGRLFCGANASHGYKQLVKIDTTIKLRYNIAISGNGVQSFDFACKGRQRQ